MDKDETKEATLILKDPDYNIFFKNSLQESLEFSYKLRLKDRELTKRAMEEIEMILNEPLAKENIMAKVAIYKDLMSRHIVSTPQVSMQYIESKSEQTIKRQNVDPPPKLDIEELKRRATDVLKAEQEASEWKKKAILAKKS